MQNKIVPLAKFSFVPLTNALFVLLSTPKLTVVPPHDMFVPLSMP